MPMREAARALLADESNVRLNWASTIVTAHVVHCAFLTLGLAEPVLSCRRDPKRKLTCSLASSGG
eukprot:2880341-Prymnesium_polylepis.1